LAQDDGASDHFIVELVIGAGTERTTCGCLPVPEPGSVASGFDPRELVREQELSASAQQSQAALLVRQLVSDLGFAGLGRVLSLDVPLGLRDQRVDLDQGTLAIG
jgi:hypothetical protein